MREMAPVTSASPRRWLRVKMPASTRPNFSRSFSMKNIRNGTVAVYRMTPSVSPTWAKSARVVSSCDSDSFTSRMPRESSGRMLPIRSRSRLTKSMTWVSSRRMRVW